MRLEKRVDAEGRHPRRGSSVMSKKAGTFSSCTVGAAAEMLPTTKRTRQQRPVSEVSYTVGNRHEVHAALGVSFSRVVITDALVPIHISQAQRLSVFAEKILSRAPSSGRDSLLTAVWRNAMYVSGLSKPLYQSVNEGRVVPHPYLENYGQTPADSSTTAASFGQQNLSSKASCSYALM